MEILGYLVIGVVVGAAISWYIGMRTPADLGPSVAGAVLGAVVGGVLTRQLGAADTASYLGAAIGAVLGVIVVRVGRQVLGTRRR